MLRIWPAVLVLGTHVEIYKELTDHTHLDIHSVVVWGHQGVNFFFVLSGFLITYLMLSEQRLSGKIDIPKFYARRVLRVWPLYFLIVAISFFVVPWLLPMASYSNSHLTDFRTDLLANFWQVLACYILMVPNLAMNASHVVNSGAQCWTVGVEEQFYVLWPLIFFLFRKRPIAMMVGAIVTKFALLAAIDYALAQSLASTNFELTNNLKIASRFVSSFALEALSVGGIAAYLLLEKGDSITIRLLRSKGGWIVALAPLLLYPLLPHNHRFIGFGYADFVCAISFAALIIANAKSGTAPTSWLGKTLNYFGTITYGIYMFNILAICIVLEMTRTNQSIQGNDLIFNLVLYGGSFALTLLMSVASYELFESKFLKKKRKFSVIDTSQS